MMSQPLLSTKHHIPHLRENSISRPRLTEKLQSGVKRPGSFVLLSGPPGFGKTTLLIESLAGLRQPVAWLSLDSADNDPIRFWNYLIAACQSIGSEIGQSVLALLQLPQSLPDETIPTILINDIEKSDAPLWLVLDDYHTIQNQSIHGAIAFLLEHIPDKLHLVISTRVDPPWALARFRARDQLVEIRAADLRFTVEEAAAFLNQVMGLDLSGENITALEERTEGWIASLQLAAISMKGRTDVAGFIQAFTGSHVYVAEYLIEEVLGRQTGNVKDFLLQTSILKQMNASLCDFVTGRTDSETMLKDLCQANLFVIPLDDEGQWFRYHHLFSDLLRSRLQQHSSEEIASLHRRAAAWYEQAGLVNEAIEHAQAAHDPSLQVRLVEKTALPMILQAYVGTVEGWLKAIPAQFLEQSIQLNMAYAWLFLLRGAFDKAAFYMDHLQSMFSVEPEVRDPHLLGEWLAIQSNALGAQGRPEESRDLAVKALEILPAEDAHVRSMVLVNLTTAYQQMLDYDQAARTFCTLVREAQALGNFTLEIIGISGEARMLLQQGELHLAYETASNGIRRIETTGKSTPFSATLFGELGQIHYFWHDLDQTQSYLSQSIRKSGQTGYSDPEIYHHIVLSRIHQMEGNREASAEELQKAVDLARMAPPAMVREELVSQQVRVHLNFDRFPAAQAVLEPEGFHFDGEFSFPRLAPGSNVTHYAGLLYNSALRVLLCEAKAKGKSGNLQRGIEFANLVLAGELQCRHIPIALETLLLRGQLFAANGNEQDSLADTAKALELAEAEGFISSFVEEGPPIAAALSVLLKEGLPGNINPNYVQKILAAFPGKAVPGDAPSGQVGRAFAPAKEEVLPLIEQLTPREMEVLQRIAAGDSNQDIAGRLVITLSAVKKHTGNIFNKLNVDSRTQAIARARQLGLLSPD
jgi:LuxR family maltose regulon positive regulatory protein